MKSKLFLILGFLAVTSWTVSAQCNSNKQVKNASYTSAMENDKDIIDVATSSDDFSTLTTAIKTAGLVETLQGDGPFTVFAPVNSAFSKLPDGTVTSLLEPSAKDQLTNILTYHVVAGEFKATDVVQAIQSNNGSFTVETVSGGTLTAKLADGNVILTDANGGTSAVIKTDVAATNGVIHVIDSVLLPK